MLLGSGVAAAGLLMYFRPLQEQRSASVRVASAPPRLMPKTPITAAVQSTSRTSARKAPAESNDDKAKPLEKTLSESRKHVGAAGSEPARQAQASASKPDEPLAIVADLQNKTIHEEPTAIVNDVPRKPDPLRAAKKPLDVPKEPEGVPEKPKLDIVADRPKGLYEVRTKPKTPAWLAQRGGTVESQQAVEDGLNWLARHQGQDGHWGADCLGGGPNSRCAGNPCGPPGSPYEIAQTGLAVLAFQAAGHYCFNSQKYSGQVANGLDYLVQEQAPDGSIVGSLNPTPERISAGAPFNGMFMYEHAIGTFALCEACAVAIAEGKMPEPRYRQAAQRAVSFIQSIQHDDGGWRYSTNPRDKSDCSVSGWVMLALKTAREAEIDVSPKTISRMIHFFALHYVGGPTAYLRPTVAEATGAMTGVGMMAVEFLEHKLDSLIVQRGAAYLADRTGTFAPLPRGDAGFEERLRNASKNTRALVLPDYYLWCNCTTAMFQVGDERWQRWNNAIRDPLVALQVQGEGCDRGSWPVFDTYDLEGGPNYTTALAVLTLEVYYRFQRVAGRPEQEKFFKK